MSDTNNQAIEFDIENKSTWEKLNQVNVNLNTKKKGKFTYLSWAWAWAELMRVCPNAVYQMLPLEIHRDDTVTVWTSMTINGVTHSMWLPVMDHKNNSLTNPDSMAINKARMRCLVKNIAIFGLGIYIYEGEDLPETPPFDFEAFRDTINVIKEGIDTGELSAASEAWFELSTEEKQGLWVAPSKNPLAPFTTHERKVMQTTEFREANGAIQ